MRLLLDTNALLWALGDPERLRAALASVSDPANQVYASLVSPWEIAIRVGLGKLFVPPELATWLPAALTDLGLSLLPIELHHVLAVERLPLHHRDPFDHLLIAQATVENLTTVTGDAQFERDAVQVLRC